MNGTLVDFLTDRYPCIAQPLRDTEILIYDNLYLNLSREIQSWTFQDVELRDAAEVGSELQSKVFELIERVFALVKPRQVFFVAVDGVPPLAKISKAKKRCVMGSKQDEASPVGELNVQGESFPSSGFDFNSITPGTVFMEKLQSRLKRYFRTKAFDDPFWRAVQVIYSGYDCPGDGEQKILSYIRSIRAKEGYNPNTRHCMYGLDADLIILGLATHEPNFSLLYNSFHGRESRIWSGTTYPAKLFLLHLCLLRQYLLMEFDQLRVKDGLSFDFERRLDDWIFLACLSNGDAAPNLKNLGAEALPTLWRSYVHVFGNMEGYLNEEGQLNLESLEVYFEKLAEIDRDEFYEHFIGLLWLRSKSGTTSKTTPEISLDRWTSDFWTGCSLSPSSGSDESIDDFSLQWDIAMEEDFLNHRINYYKEKFNLKEVDEFFVRKLKVSYLQALQWTLKYYYEGVTSWRWFYPYFYSPFVTDLKGLQGVELQFPKDSPLLPFQYMLAVLPSTSSHLFPPAYRELFPSSQESDGPTYFGADMNAGEGGSLAGTGGLFADLDLLVEAAQSRDRFLTLTERCRNKPGYCSLYKYRPEMRQRCNSGPLEGFDLSPEEVVHGLLPDAKELLASFTSSEHLHFKATIPALTTISDSSSRPVVVSVMAEGDQNVETVASRLLGKWLLAKWPYRIPAFCTAMSNSTDSYACSVGELGTITHSEHDLKSAEDWKALARKLEIELRCLKAIEVKEVRTIVHCLFPSAIRFPYEMDGKKMEFRFDAAAERVPYDTVVPATDVDRFFLQRFEDTEPLLRHLGPVFSLAKSTYGQQGAFLCRLSDDAFRVRLEHSCESALHASLSSLAQLEGDHWVDTDQLSKEIKMPKSTICRLTGTVPLLRDRGKEKGATNIGLNVRLPEPDIHVPGYAERTADGRWIYSRQTTFLLIEYRRRFPEVVEAIGEHPRKRSFIAADFWQIGERNERMTELASWLRQLPRNSIRPQPYGTTAVDYSILRHVEKTISSTKDRLRPHVEGNFSSVDLKASELYCPSLILGKWPPHSLDDYGLLDRVVCVQSCFAVPLGFAGTVIQLPPEEKLSTTELLVLFDEEFTGAFRPDGCRTSTAYYVPAEALINVSRAMRRP